MIRSLIQFAAPPSVQQRWGEWLRPRDEPQPPGTGGVRAQADGDTHLSARTVYGIGILLIVLSGVVGTFSNARDVTWRLGSPQNLWEPALWETTSNLVAIALLPLARRGAILIGSGRHRPFMLCLALVALALCFSALHITGIGLLREWAYGILGYSYSFPWARQIPYEARKDLFAFTAFVVVFWLGRRAVSRPAIVTSKDVQDEVAQTVATAPRPETYLPATQFWLRDGRISVLVDANEIIAVGSAGNYVEYQLTGGRNHLVRATLQSQEARLVSLGIVRVHRSRLVNLKRVVALEWRASGDFDIRLDSGETFVGSRRFKAAVANLAEG
jgi:hypothetical protein